MTKKTTKKSPLPLTAHGLLGSLSYWGSTARLILVTVFVVFAYALNVSGAAGWQEVDAETMTAVYAFATLFVLDVGYVIAARALPMHPRFDRWFVILSDLVVAGFFVTPSLVSVGTYGERLKLVSFVVVLLVVAVRILLGLLMSKRKR